MNRGVNFIAPWDHTAPTSATHLRSETGAFPLPDARPCYKVGLRLEEPRMPALIYSHGRPGFYMRVLEGGDVGAGD